MLDSRHDPAAAEHDPAAAEHGTAAAERDPAAAERGTAALLHARAVRAWRIALIAYLVPVSVLTHWPRLGFGGGGVIDKFIHFLGFGVLAWLWMHARPFGRATAGFVCAAAWVYVDERTQALEILGRTFSLHDMVAGWIGVAIAGAMYAASRCRAPAGTDARADADTLVAIAYGRGAHWAIAAVVTLAVMVVVGACMLGVDWWREGAISFGHVVYAIGFGGFIGVVVAAMVVEGGFARFGFEGTIGRRPVTLDRGATAGVPRLLAAMAIAFLLLAGYRGLVLAMFGAEPSEELATDAEGFRVLAKGFMFAAIVLAILGAESLLARRAFRADPARARRGGGAGTDRGTDPAVAATPDGRPRR